jgi:hypothetical protein
METYRFYPPQLRSTRFDYHVLRAGSEDCDHELLELDWRERISVQDGIVVVTFSCKRCGRQLGQSLDEVVSPASWKGGNSNRKTPQAVQPVSTTAQV